MRKFYLKTLFLACTMLMSVSSAWGLNEDIIETYDFENWGKAHMNKDSRRDTNGTVDAGFKVNGVNMYYLNIVGTKDSQEWDLSNRFAVSNNVCYRWPSGKSDVPRLGSENQSGVRYISIIGLKDGDRVSFIANNVNFYSNNATYLEGETKTDVVSGTAITSDTEYTIKGEGWQHLDLIIASSTWGYITKVVITRNVEVEAVSSKSWDFTKASWAKETGFGTSTINVNSYTCTYASGDLEGIALQGGSGTGWIVNNKGLTQGNGTRNIGVLDLKAQDLVIVTGSVNISNLVNATNTNGATTGTCKYRINSDGVFGFSIDKNPNYLTSITVYREVLPAVSDGDYYLKNKETGAYFTGGLNWGTQAITNDIGRKVKFTLLTNNKYTIDTYLYNGGTGASTHFLNQWLWCDGNASDGEFSVKSDGEGYYTISYDGNNLTAGASGELLTLTSGTGDNTKWQFLTADEWNAENVARLDAATATNGVDATFYISSPNFGRNDDLENAKWQGNPTIGGLDGNGVVSNYNAEKFTNPFATWDVYQNLTGLKSGAYKLTVQGFNRHGLENEENANDRSAILYANTNSVPLVNIRSVGYTTDEHSSEGFTTNRSGYYVPNSQTDASKAFNADNYNNKLYFVVGDDGALRFGVKKDAGIDHDWTAFDNFQLTYYGETVSKTISSAGWATYCSPYALDFTSDIANLTNAYLVTGESGTGGYGTYLTLTSVKGGTVPANTGLLLKGKGECVIPVVASSSTDVTANKLVGVTTETVVSAGIYVLLNGDNGIGFYRATNDFTVGANSAYLPADAFSAKAIFYNFNDDTTGLETISNSENELSGEFFDLSGRKVAKPTKGLYIMNGKKVFIK